VLTESVARAFAVSVDDDGRAVLRRTERLSPSPPGWEPDGASVRFLAVVVAGSEPAIEARAERVFTDIVERDPAFRRRADACRRGEDAALPRDLEQYAQGAFRERFAGDVVAADLAFAAAARVRDVVRELTQAGYFRGAAVGEAPSPAVHPLTGAAHTRALAFLARGAPAALALLRSRKHQDLRSVPAARAFNEQFFVRYVRQEETRRARLAEAPSDATFDAITLEKAATRIGELERRDPFYRLHSAFAASVGSSACTDEEWDRVPAVDVDGNRLTREQAQEVEDRLRRVAAQESARIVAVSTHISDEGLRPAIEHVLRRYGAVLPLLDDFIFVDPAPLPEVTR
jgi:hypothetical protein